MMPIRDVVIFPHMMTPFVVGRESSVRALEEALAGDRKIFLATQLVDANFQREVVPGVRGFVSVENLFDANYQVNISGSGTTASPLIVSRGLPRTVRVGVEAYRF